MSDVDVMLALAGLEAQLAEVNTKLEASCAEASSLREETLALKSTCQQLESDILREKESARTATREMNLAQAQSSHMQLQVCGTATFRLTFEIAAPKISCNMCALSDLPSYLLSSHNHLLLKLVCT